MRVIFFGTPEFAVPSFRALLAHDIQVAAVVTQPDKPQGRSRSTLVPPPVKRAAVEAGVPVLQPERPVGDVFVTGLRHLRPRPDLGVVVAYGHILRPEILEIPPLGMINVHASLLPRYRGAAPIQWAILNGESETGVSIMQMDRGLDTGPVLLRVPTAIGPDETAGELSERLAELGAKALIEAIGRISRGEAKPEPQDHAAATYAPKVDREAARLSFGVSAAVAARKIRAFDPSPGAWAVLDGTPVKFFGGRVVSGGGRPGQVLAASRSLVVACAEHALEIAEVQPAGKPRLPADAWARGRGVRVGDTFE